LLQTNHSFPFIIFRSPTRSSPSSAFIFTMEDLFNILSSSARIDKSKRKKKRRREEKVIENDGDVSDEEELQEEEEASTLKSRDRTGKRDKSEAKRQQIQREEMSAFRRQMKIQTSGENVPDCLSNFGEIQQPSWWKQSGDRYAQVLRSIIGNIEEGDWKEPTSIQMQGIPALLERRDVLASAPTGSGKSGAFCIPALLLSAACVQDYYATGADDTASNGKKGKKKKEQSRQGEIRSLLLAPSRELAQQLHREVERMGRGRPGGLTSLLLTRSNANQVSQAGGQKGLDVLVSTPLRLLDVLEKEALKLDAVRLVVLDEADRLLDATDQKDSSGSAHTKTFVSQLDSILANVPTTATRALFSATITPSVQELSDSILRQAIHITIQASHKVGGANPDIQQELLFCGREEGKLLAVRQLVARGELKPPALIFCQSQERAQALFSELLYDNLHVDVLHAGRSPAAREAAVANFRKGNTWILICTDLVARGIDFCSVKLVINYDLPMSGVTYVHRIGRTGRAGRKGKALTFFTEADLDNLRTVANVIRQSGCDVPDWMLSLKKQKQKQAPRRAQIDTTPRYDKMKRQRKQQSIENSRKKKRDAASS
jgi:ATP-dependent RNA helicase DDX52/ROK1